MLSRANENEWERVCGLDVKRRELVELCFRHETSAQDAPETAAAIKEILRLNQALTELGKTRQEALGADIRLKKVGRAALAAYSSCAR